MRRNISTELYNQGVIIIVPLWQNFRKNLYHPDPASIRSTLQFDNTPYV